MGTIKWITLISHWYFCKPSSEYFLLGSFWVDHHGDTDQNGDGEHVVHDVAADHGGVHGGDGGEHEEGDQAAEQLAGPGQSRLVIQQTNVGQTPQAVEDGHQESSLWWCLEFVIMIY